MGPVSLDLEMARRHGWTERELESLWRALVDAYLRRDRNVVTRNPHLHHRCKDGTLLFIGPDANGRRIKRPIE